MKKQTTIVIPAFPHILRAIGAIVIVIGICAAVTELYYFGMSCDGDCAARNAYWGSAFTTLGVALFNSFALFALAFVVDYLTERSSDSSITE